MGQEERSFNDNGQRIHRMMSVTIVNVCTHGDVCIYLKIYVWIIV